ncbi:DUF4190 domain-containing protein [Kutzneria sp. NPDC052558]|uniref:DUF4190 domain-containing protein n=1 Tax=Kutzneria sp. NPDC052558 TaxID=3364121 RepID=UPI0037C5A894
MEPEQPAYQNYPPMPPAQPSLPPGLPGQAGSWGQPWPGQGPWPGQPGPMGGQPWPSPRPGTSGFAITSFVLGVFGFFLLSAILSLVFGILGLSGIRQTRQSGKGLAIAGIVLAGLWLVLWAVFFIAAVVVGVRDAANNSASSTSTGFRLKPGQCFDRPVASSTAAVTVRDCATPHDAEAFAAEPVSGSAYPGVYALENLGDRKCAADSARWLTPGMNYPDFAVHYLYPEQSSWLSGDRTVVCFYRRVDTAPMTGHVKDVGLPLSDDQKRYLDAVAPYNKIIDDESDAAMSGSWTAEKAVVARSIPVVQKEIDDLKAGPWPTNAQSGIDSLIAEKQQELAARQQAAAATDEDTMDDALDTADVHNGDTEDESLRTALHLPPR